MKKIEGHAQELENIRNSKIQNLIFGEIQQQLKIYNRKENLAEIWKAVNSGRIEAAYIKLGGNLAGIWKKGVNSERIEAYIKLGKIWQEFKKKG